MITQEKKVYEAPELTVVTVKAERGYAASSPFWTRELEYFFLVQEDDDALESRTPSSNYWGGQDENKWF